MAQERSETLWEKFIWLLYGHSGVGLLVVAALLLIAALVVRSR